MLYNVALKKNTSAIRRLYQLQAIYMMDAKLSTIARKPIRVEVKYHGVFAAIVVGKLIEVFMIKSACFVDGKMKLVASDACVASSIEVGHKSIHHIQKIVFGRLLVAAV